MEKILKAMIDKNSDYVVVTTQRVFRFCSSGKFMSSEGGMGEEAEAHHFVGKWKEGRIYSDFFGDVTDELGNIPKNVMKIPPFLSWQERFPRTEECPIDDW
jgi:hypothetical protein